MTFKAGVTYLFSWYSTLAVLAPLPAKSLATPTAMPGTGAPLTGNLNGPGGFKLGWGPPAVATALKFPVQSGFNGTGTTIAVLMDSNLYANDLAQFLSYFSITETNPVGVELMTGASSTPTSDLQEATLDVETIAGLAPGAKIVVYVMPALNLLSFNNALELVQQAGQATIISYSAAACESSASSGTSSVIASLSSSIAIIAAAAIQQRML